MATLRGKPNSLRVQRIYDGPAATPPEMAL